MRLILCQLARSVVCTCLPVAKPGQPRHSMLSHMKGYEKHFSTGFRADYKIYENVPHTKSCRVIVLIRYTENMATHLVVCCVLWHNHPSYIGIMCEVGSTTWNHWSVTLSFWSEEVSNWLKDVCQHRASAIIWTPNSILRSYSLQQSVGRVNYVVSVHVRGLKSFSLHKMTDVECTPNRSCSKHCSWSRALHCGTRMSSKILYSHVSPQSQDQLFSSRVIRDLVHALEWQLRVLDFITKHTVESDIMIINIFEYFARAINLTITTSSNPVNRCTLAITWTGTRLSRFALRLDAPVHVRTMRVWPPWLRGEAAGTLAHTHEALVHREQELGNAGWKLHERRLSPSGSRKSFLCPHEQNLEASDLCFQDFFTW